MRELVGLQLSLVRSYWFGVGWTDRFCLVYRVTVRCRVSSTPN